MTYIYIALYTLLHLYIQRNFLFFLFFFFTTRECMALYKRLTSYTGKNSNIMQHPCASEREKFPHFYIPNLLFPSLFLLVLQIFCWYNNLIILLLVYISIIRINCTDVKTPQTGKGIIGGRGQYFFFTVYYKSYKV